MFQSRSPIDAFMTQWTGKAAQAQHKLQKASDILRGPLDTRIAVTPCDVVYTEDRVSLKHYRPASGTAVKTPLLIVYALINRQTMLDLQPDRSVVKSLLDRGIDVYMIDWGYPSRKDRYLTIDDHVNGYMDNIVDFICRRTGMPAINLMGICMGGTLSVIYSALHPGRVKNLITTVTPTHFDTDQGLLHTWMRGVDADGMVGAFGNIPGDLLNLGFLLLNPARLMLDKYVGLLERGDDKAFVENFVRMEKWIFDSPDLPGETFRQFIKDCYQQNLLIQSKMQVGDRRVDLKNITMPVLNFFGKFDHLVPPAACDRLTKMVGSTDTEDVCLQTGHIGIYVSGRCQKEFVPRIVQWLQQRDRRAPGAAVAEKRYDGGKSESAPIAARRQLKAVQ